GRLRPAGQRCADRRRVLRAGRRRPDRVHVAMLELYQAEWCPASSRVRQRLTELGVDFVARQVPAERADRGALRRLTGGESIPVLVLADGSTMRGEDDIGAYLDRRFEET